MRLKLTQTNRKQFNMSIYSKGSRPYRGPYSPDYTGDPVGNYQSGTNDPNAYDPVNTANEARSGKPSQKNVDGAGYDLSQQIDGDNASRGLQKEWHVYAGFSGPISGLGSPSKNHPKRGSVKKDTL